MDVRCRSGIDHHQIVSFSLRIKSKRENFTFLGQHERRSFSQSEFSSSVFKWNQFSLSKQKNKVCWQNEMDRISHQHFSMFRWSEKDSSWTSFLSLNFILLEKEIRNRNRSISTNLSSVTILNVLKFLVQKIWLNLFLSVCQYASDLSVVSFGIVMSSTNILTNSRYRTQPLQNLSKSSWMFEQRIRWDFSTTLRRRKSPSFEYFYHFSGLIGHSSEIDFALRIRWNENISGR